MSMQPRLDIDDAESHRAPPDPGVRTRFTTVTALVASSADDHHHVAEPLESKSLLSYRHAFHAGNHADVLKHVTLVLLLDYLTGKPKPLWYIDTHAGAGVYDLERGFATQLAEHVGGIGRLWDVPPPTPALERYVELIRSLNPDGRLRRYPGSPWLAQQLLRADDRLWLFELHAADHAVLAETIRGRRVRVAREDGLRGLRGLLPPEPRRALALIDPSYEVKSEYRQVCDTLRDALRRFRTGVYAVWYPLIERAEAREFPASLRVLGADRWLHVELQVRRAGPGMYGSGLFVINPPYTLPDSLEPTLAALARRLGEDEAATYRLEWQID